MAVPVRQEPADTAAGLVEQLKNARGRPSDAVLRRAVSCAAQIAPAVIELVEKAADDVYLTPAQANLLFWGVHALGGARRTELCRPLLLLLQNLDDESLHIHFGDGLADTVCRVIISVFDGEMDMLFATIAHRCQSDFARWGLLSALARLTFDGAIPRDRTLQILDRFEREPLAEPGAVAWEGWLQCVVYLGFEELHDRFRHAWSEGRMCDEISSLDDWEQQIAIVRAMAPGDPGLLDRDKLTAVNDPAEMLRWLASDAEVANGDVLPDDDPAIGILRSYEREWLEGFLLSKHVPVTAMTVERLDGYFTALAICPSEVERSEYWPPLWNYDDEADAEPSYDTAEQESYVTDLLDRYIEAVKLRIAAGHPHPGLYVAADDDDEEERNWAAGFIRGVVVCAPLWRDRAEADEDCRMFMNAVYTVATGQVAGAEQSFSPRERTAFFKKLPTLLRYLHRTWRGLPAIRPPAAGASSEDTWRRFGRKIGRNEPCPCGSGKKYKRCCGSATSTLN
jgi:yecA family protein